MYRVWLSAECMACALSMPEGVVIPMGIILRAATGVATLSLSMYCSDHTLAEIFQKVQFKLYSEGVQPGTCAYITTTYSALWMIMP